MDTEFVVMGELLRTNGARERFLAGVNSLVADEEHPMPEALSAHLANMRWFSDVGSHVRPPMFGTHRYCTAYAALATTGQNSNAFRSTDGPGIFLRMYTVVDDQRSS